METLLKVKDYKVYYQTLKGHVKAIDGVDFFVRSREVLGIAGESGCGKSTLSNSLINIKAPMIYEGGEVYFDGVDITKLDVNKMRTLRYTKMSIIPQYAMDAMSPTKKIKRIIFDLVREHDRKIAEEEIISIARGRFKEVGLVEYVLNKYPVELSGGMKQRVVMVISTLMNPKLLIADEITSALDVSSQKFTIEMLEEFMDKGYVDSVIFITHDLSVLYQIADRIMIMYAGNVAEIGTTEEIIKSPLHPYTKMLVESLPKMDVQYKKKKLKGIPGHPPNLLNYPSEGCRFYERCPVKINPQKCKLQKPPLFEVKPGRYVACWAYAEGEKGE